MSALVQLINCQFFDHILSLGLKSPMLDNSHCTLELIICALINLTFSNLAYLNETVENPLVSTKSSFIYLFFTLGFEVCLS
jgi:hypothetical protein